MTKATEEMSDDEIVARGKEIEEQRAAQAEADRQAADEAHRADLRARYAPLVALVDGPAFAAVRDEAATVRDDLMSPQTKTAYGMIDALHGLMTGLAQQIPAEARAAEA